MCQNQTQYTYGQDICEKSEHYICAILRGLQAPELSQTILESSLCLLLTLQTCSAKWVIVFKTGIIISRTIAVQIKKTHVNFWYTVHTE